MRLSRKKTERKLPTWKIRNSKPGSYRKGNKSHKMNSDHIIPEFKPEEHELAELRLAILKENFKYREFYEKLKETPHSMCPELRNPNESDYQEYQHRVTLLKIRGTPFFGGYAKIFGVYDDFFPEVQKYADISTKDILSLLDPQKDIINVSRLRLIEMLPLLFTSRCVYEFGKADYSTTGSHDIKYRRYNLPMEIDLNPYEKLLKIDLRKKKKQLVSEFKNFVDYELTLQKAAIELEGALREEESNYSLETAYEWEPYNSRDRKEAWVQLKVWKLRRQRKAFPEIAKGLGLTEDTARKCFYRAYNLTQGRPYDPETLRKEIWVVRISELQRTCDSCPVKATCTTLCPETLAYVGQDVLSHSREKILKKDSDSLKDYLSLKNPIL